MASLEGADLFHADRGTAPWAGLSVDLRQQALQRATDYIDAQYGPRLVPTTPPAVIDKAIYIAAGIEARAPAFFSVTSTPASPGKVLVGVGDIRWQIVGDAAANGGRPVASLIEALLEPYLGGGAFGLAAMVV